MWSAGGGCRLVSDPGGGFLRPVDEWTFHDLVAQHVDERVEEDAAVGHHHGQVAGSVVVETTRLQVCALTIDTQRYT